MATSWTSICNQSLGKLGTALISNIDTDTGPNAVKCRALYEGVRDELLRLHDWNCAIERKELAVLGTTPVFDWSYEYTLPTSPYCLRVLNTEGNYPFEVAGRKLLTNQNTCKIRYIARITDPTKLDPLFIRVMVFQLASQLAIPITSSGTLKDRMDREFKDAILEAEGTDAIEGEAQDRDQAETDLWIDAGR